MRGVWINQVNQDISQCRPFDRLGGVLGKSRSRGITLPLGHDVSGEGNHWDMRVVVLLLPCADLAAGCVTVFVGHLNIALQKSENEMGA